MTNCRILLSVLMLGLLSACAINQNVVALDQSHKITSVCIKNNPKVLMKEGFLPELESQIHSHGIETSVYEGNIPEGCQYSLEYTANWAWDLAMYLTYLHIEIREDGNVIASADYDARRGGGNMGKFGHTADKMRPLLDKMFGKSTS